MPILLTALIYYLALLVLMAAFGLLSVIVSYIVGRLSSRSTQACSRYIKGWRTMRGLRNRIILAPLAILLTMLAVFEIGGLVEARRVRRRITEATKLIIRSGGNCHRNKERECILFKTEEKNAIEEVSMQIVTGLTLPGMHCMCCGTMTFDLYLDQKLHYSFTLHHGQSIRIKGDSFGDKKLSFTSRLKLAKWLDENGVTQKLEEFSSREEQRRKNEALKEMAAKETLEAEE